MKRHGLVLAVLCCTVTVTVAAEPEKDFKPVTVDGEDVAAVSRERLSRGTMLRLHLITRGKGGAFRFGEARTPDAGVSTMMKWDAVGTTLEFSQRLRADTYLVFAAGPKESPLKLEKIETDAESGASKLTFEGGLVVEVTLEGFDRPASRPGG